MSGRAAFRSYTHAAKGFDCEFEQHLAARITEVIALESRVDDVAAIVLRTCETITALTTCSATMLALCPELDVPSKLRRAVEQLAKRIRRDAARANAEGLGDRLGAGKWTGHA
jgi:hypothetical protein